MDSGDATGEPGSSSAAALAYRPNVKALSRVVQGHAKLNERIGPTVKQINTSGKRGRGESTLGDRHLSAEEAEELAHEVDRRRRKRLLDEQIASTQASTAASSDAAADKKLSAPSRLFSQAMFALKKAAPPMPVQAEHTSAAAPASSSTAAHSADEAGPQPIGRAVKAKPKVRGKGRTKAPV